MGSLLAQRTVASNPPPQTLSPKPTQERNVKLNFIDPKPQGFRVYGLGFRGKP